MSELRSAIEGFRSEDLGSLPDARAEEDFVELARARELLESEYLRRLADLDRRGSYRRDGHLSTASWLVSTSRTGWGEARRAVRVARALEAMPRVRDAFETGEISSASVRALADARSPDPDAFARSEHILLDAARIHTVGDLCRVLGHWRSACERDVRVRGDDPTFARRRLHASATAFGMVRIDGDLDAETGESLLTALRAVVDAETRGGTEPDGRTPAQCRADALGEICRRYLDASDRPSVAGERPHVSVTVPLAALTGHGEGTAELAHAGPVSAGVARRLACDASVIRVVLSPRSEPLDVGRRTPVVPPAIRRAVVVRDQRCRFPGCDRPHAWCDAHHVRHWADGGETKLANLVLLCRRHHRAVHMGFGLEMSDGHPVFTRPDGSVLEERAPP